MTRYEALLACRDKAGSDSQLARDLKTSQPKVWRWINQSKQMPAEFVMEAERLYQVPCYFLRPDLYPRDRFDARFLGVDRRAPHWVGLDLGAGLDQRSTRVAFNSLPISQQRDVA